jgi:hypothetical protein
VTADYIGQEDLTAAIWELQAIQQIVMVDIKATRATHESMKAQMDVNQHKIEAEVATAVSACQDAMEAI